MIAARIAIAAALLAVPAGLTGAWIRSADTRLTELSKAPAELAPVASVTIQLHVLSSGNSTALRSSRGASPDAVSRCSNALHAGHSGSSTSIAGVPDEPCARAIRTITP